MRPFKAVLLALSASVLALGTARADVKPHPIFSDNMVLQQGTEIVVWRVNIPPTVLPEKLSKSIGLYCSAKAGAKSVAFDKFRHVENDHRASAVILGNVLPN